MAASDHTEGCAAPECTVETILNRPHLRVQLSPPDQSWTFIRVCDLLCLIAWLEAESTAGELARVFTQDAWIDSHG